MSDPQLSTEIIRACVRRGIREFVVCGGARNASLIAALESAPFARVWNHFDERGAGFFALGRTIATGEACAVIVTSGTAVAELLPSVIEAYYQQRPLVIITADRPKRFRGSGAPQAIEQSEMFTSYVEACRDIDQADQPILTNWTGRGPFQLNVCLEEDAWADQNVLLDEGPEFVPHKLKTNVGELAQFLRDDLFGGFVVLLGGLDPEDREDVYHFLTKIKVPVVADATSGLREALGKLILPDADRALLAAKPRKILRIGDVPVGRFWRDLEELSEIQICSLTRTGFSGLARESLLIKGEISKSIKGLGDVDEIGDVQDLLVSAGRKRMQIDELIEVYTESEPAFMRLISLYAMCAESVYLGNSLPIREWNDFAQRDHVFSLVRANRGANGIDGQIASWLGATADEEAAWAILGDLTTHYDLTSLSLLERVQQKNRVLVVINNRGGRIFDRLKGLSNAQQATKDAMRCETTIDWSSIASAYGMAYQKITNADAFEIEPLDNKTLLVEICPDDAQTEKFLAKC